MNRPKKAYTSFDEWWSARSAGLFSLKGYSEYWAREAWKQATRTARVQETILLGEILTLKSAIANMEEKISDWAMEVREEYGE